MAEVLKPGRYSEDVVVTYAAKGGLYCCTDFISCIVLVHFCAK